MIKRRGRIFVSRQGCAVLAVCLLLFGVVGVSMASPYPDSGVIYRQFKDGSFRRVEPLRKPEVSKPLQESAPQPGTTAADSVPVFVSSFMVHGNVHLSEEAIQSVLVPYTGRELTLQQLYDAANTLMRSYRDAGMFAAKVFIPPQHVDQGVVELVVYEGILADGGVELENTEARVDNDVLLEILHGNLQEGDVLLSDKVEHAILLIEDTPGVHSDVTLYPGLEAGTAKLHVRAIDDARVHGNVDVDNFGGYYTGKNRLGATVYVNSPAGRGDQLTLRAVTSGSDSNYAYIRYDISVSGKGTRVGVSSDYLDYSLGKEYRALGSEGNAFEFLAFVSHPVKRSRHSSYHAQVDYQLLRLNDHDDAGTLAERTINSAILRFYGEHDDDWFVDGETYFSLDLTLGSLDVEGGANYLAFDQQYTKTEGGFGKLNFTVSRLQHISGPYSAFLSLSGQWANKNLDTSQKYYIGGPFSVPGYPTGEATGDDAALLHLDIRRDMFIRPWGGILQLSLFYTYGWSALYKDPWPGWQGSNPVIDNNVTLQSAGLGAHQTWQNVVIRGLIGWQLGESAVRDPVTGADSDGSDKDYRAWMQGIYYF